MSQHLRRTFDKGGMEKIKVPVVSMLHGAHSLPTKPAFGLGYTEMYRDNTYGVEFGADIYKIDYGKHQIGGGVHFGLNLFTSPKNKGLAFGARAGIRNVAITQSYLQPNVKLMLGQKIMAEGALDLSRKGTGFGVRLGFMLD